jgi:uncharacterized membrane protein YdjX (TVP38/TMEM64 family)
MLLFLACLQVVLLLRLSPLLPLALSNYLYGLTSVDFVPYVLGSWLGMLPGTIAYVSAGGRHMFASKLSQGTTPSPVLYSQVPAVSAGST